MSEVQPAATLEANSVNIDGRGGKREACGYLCASVGRGPDAVNPSFYVVAILSLAFLDARCFDASNPKYDGKKCTQYSYVEFTYARSSLEAIDWPQEYKMDNITEGEKGLLSYGCGNRPDPCMKPLLESEIKYPGFDTKIINLPNDWYPKFHRSMVEGVDFIQNISRKIPHDLIPKEHTCDCRGGHARLGSKNGIAPSTVVSYSLPILCSVEIVLFPYVAALTDYSEHRKLVWLVGFSLTQLTAVLVAIMWHNYVWVVALASTVLNAIFFDLQLFPIQAYLPEFGDTRALVKLSGLSQAVNSSGQLAFVVIGVVFSVVMPMMLGRLYGTICTAMIATVLVGVFGVGWTVPAALRLQERSATQLPKEWQGKSLMLVGFLRIGRTACEALKKYPQVVKFWAYQALMLTWAYATIFVSSTYFSQQLRMGQVENVLVVLCVLVCIIPGAIMIVWINKYVGHKWLLVSVATMATVLLVFPAFLLWQPRQKVYAYPFGVLAGCIFGAHYGLRSGVYASIIPGGQEALYTAVGMWFGNLLRWLPGVLYGLIVNLSATQSHRWAFFHLAIYPLIALCIVVFVDFTKAESDIAESLKDRKTDNSTTPTTRLDTTNSTNSLISVGAADVVPDASVGADPVRDASVEGEGHTNGVPNASAEAHTVREVSIEADVVVPVTKDHSDGEQSDS